MQTAMISLLVLSIAVFIGLVVWLKCQAVRDWYFWHWDKLVAWRQRQLFRRWWRCVAFGGGSAHELHNMTRQQAIDYCTTRYGRVAHVDDERHHIFYKPDGYTQSHPAGSERLL